MTDTIITLDKLPAGHSATILSVGTPHSEKGPEARSSQIGSLRQHLLEMVPKELSQAILLREIDGLAYDQIAEIMKCPVGTVRSRIFRAREIVATKLQTILGDSKNSIKNMQRNQKNKEKNEKNNEKNKDK